MIAALPCFHLGMTRGVAIGVDSWRWRYDTIEDDTIEDDTIEDDTIEGDTIEDDTIEDDTIEDDTIEDDMMRLRTMVIR